MADGKHGRAWRTSFFNTFAAATTLAVASCQPSSSQKLDHREAIEAYANALISACPVSGLDDEAARDQCATQIGEAKTLRDLSNESILWGGHNPDKHSSFDPSTHHLTRFSAFVHRRVYLSTFMFKTDFTIEAEADLEVLRMPATFRNQLSPGSYAYPFWHSQDKWNAYQYATEVIVVFQEGKVTAIYRAGRDEGVQTRDPGTFDGQWRWFDEAGEEQPKVALFSYLLSSDNPHLQDLDSAFRALESEARENACLTCHAPDNISQMDQLVLLNYPNQALGSRHDLLKVFEARSMPPGGGLDAEVLQTLSGLAQEFARLGDRALEYEAQR